MHGRRMTGVILAGGEGRRLGCDKTEIVIEHESVIETIISKLSTSFEEILMVTSREKYTDCTRRFAHSNVTVCTDMFPVRGSIAGIHGGLYHASHRHAFFVGCDMPFLNLSLIDYFKQIADENDVVVARCDEGFEPLHAVYSKRCIGHLAALIQKNNLRIYDFYSDVRLRIVGEDEIKRHDPDRLSFFNINTRQALDEAHKIQQSLAQRGAQTL